jgi:hypothetical protein
MLSTHQQSQPAYDSCVCCYGVCRLPVVAAAGSKPALLSLLTRVKEHVQGHLQTTTQTTSTQQQQQQQHQQPAGRASTDAPAAKKQRAADSAGSITSANRNQQAALDALLTAYAAASNSATTGQAGGSWRVEFLGLLQELSVLHMPLLQRLVSSLRGSAWPSKESPQQVRLFLPSGLSQQVHSRDSLCNSGLCIVGCRRGVPGGATHSIVCPRCTLSLWRWCVVCDSGLVAWQPASLAISFENAAVCCAGTCLMRRYCGSAHRSATFQLALPQCQRHRRRRHRCCVWSVLRPYRLAQRVPVGTAADQLLQHCKPACTLLCSVLLGRVRWLCEDQYGPVVRRWVPVCCRLVAVVRQHQPDLLSESMSVRSTDEKAPLLPCRC